MNRMGQKSKINCLTKIILNPPKLHVSHIHHKSFSVSMFFYVDLKQILVRPKLTLVSFLVRSKMVLVPLKRLII